MMTIDEILFAFNDPQGRFPTEALINALAQQEVLTPKLLSILEKTVSQPADVPLEKMDHIVALYLLSKFREIKAFPLILRLAELPEEVLDELLDDCLTEGLPRFIVSTFNGDVDRIKQMIESEQLNRWSRDGGLRSLLGLVVLKHLQREELIDYLRRLFHSPLANDEMFVASLVNASCDLYPEELLPEINEVFVKDKVDTLFVDKKDVEHALQQEKDIWLSKRIYEEHGHAPIDDVEKDMDWMRVFHKRSNSLYDESFDDLDIPDLYADDPFFPEAVETYRRAAPKLGRNDPCFCGSGKKYKKCCLNLTE